MRKLMLDIDTLKVQSFETDGGSAARGTVLANQNTAHGQQCGSAYDACHTGLCTPQTCPNTFDSPDCTQVAGGCA